MKANNERESARRVMQNNLKLILYLIVHDELCKQFKVNTVLNSAR